MIRVFKPTDRDFTSNGDAVIVPIKARVKNNVNGEFSLELTAESRFYDYLTQGNIIIAPTPQGEQAFRINNQVQRKGDRITVKARHVFYDSENLVIADSYAVDLTCEQALNHFNATTDSTSPFTMHSDITDLNTFRCVRKSLGEAIGTVIERWGGYLVRNNWDISVNKLIGRDLGVTIRYAKNLNELTASYDFSGVATKILPVGKDGILLPELYVYSTLQYSTPYTKAVTISQDINEDDYTTEEEYQAAVIADLRAQAQTLVNKTCYPVITYSLKGKPEKVQDIGDVIQVIDERIGVNITTQVIGYEWDIITESYANLTFGNFGNTLNGLMAKVNSNTKGIVQESVGEVKTEVKNSIDKIYDLLQGSYVVYRGYDILLLDTIPIGAATHVIKFSKDGILISNSGVDGTFTKVYDITTQRLSVPSISLNGVDLGTTLAQKLEAVDILAGSNISIRRDGNKVTISAAGSKGGNKVYAGTSTPSASIGAEDDLYLQYSLYNPFIVKNSVGYGAMDDAEITEVAQNQFSAVLSGIPTAYAYPREDEIEIFFDGLIVGNTYNYSFDFQYGSGTGFLSGGNNYFSFGDSIILEKNTNVQHFDGSFVAVENQKLLFRFHAITDNVRMTADVNNLVLTGTFENRIDGIDEIYGKLNGEWEKYEGGETYTDFVGTDGTSDGASGLVPAPATTDVNKYLKGDGTWAEVQGGGSNVTITPTLSTGQKLADYSIDGTSGAIYMPTVASGDLVINPSETPTEEMNKIGVLSSVEDAYLANGKIATSAGYYVTCPLDKTLVNGVYTVRVRDGASEYNFEVRYSGSTIAKSWSTGSNNYTLTITSTTAGMSYYSGSYRNIYCDIVMMIPQMDVYSVGGINYSTTEQVIGTWMGKPLYARYIEKNNYVINNGTNYLDISNEIPNIKMLREYYYHIYDTTGNYTTAIQKPTNIFVRRTDTTKIEYNAPDSLGANDSRYIYFYLEYTKTTD